jgi:hypothetical protein
MPSVVLRNIEDMHEKHAQPKSPSRVMVASGATRRVRTKMRVAWLAAFTIAVSCSGRYDQSEAGGGAAGKGSSARAGAAGTGAVENDGGGAVPNEGGGAVVDEGDGGAVAESGGKPSAGGSMAVDNGSGAGGEEASVGESGATGSNSSAGAAGATNLGGTAGSGAGARTLIAFTPDHAFINVGKVTTNTTPPLTVTLSGPAQGDTVVVMTSADPTRLSVENVIVPAGQTSARVPVTALAQASDVIVTAKLGISLRKHVRVAADSEPREVVSLSPSLSFFPINGTRQLTVSLNLPALSGGAVVKLALAPSDAGSVPATITVEEDQLAAAFNFTDGGLFTGIIASATRGTSSASATLVREFACPPLTTLLISEVRTRGPGGSLDDFVELYNPTSTPILFDTRYHLVGHSSTSPTSSGFVGGGGYVPAHGHVLYAGKGSTLSADAPILRDLPDASSLELWYNPTPQSGALFPTPNDKVVDQVCFAYDDSSKAFVTSNFSCTPAANPHDETNASNQDVSIERKPGGLAGNCLKSGSNVNDFMVSKPSNPQNSSSPITPPAGL